ncbi:MAG: AraC family transcriptional regulator [Xanthobacteraceae bacterium]
MSLTNKALWVIERNLERSLTLAELADACGVSRYHLAHAFARATGIPLMQYIRKQRLTVAAHRLRRARPRTSSSSRWTPDTDRMKRFRERFAVNSARHPKKFAGRKPRRTCP